MLLNPVAKILDISPQPFQVTELLACDQVKSTDRLYVDEKGFVANILLDVGRSSYIKCNI